MAVEKDLLLCFVACFGHLSLRTSYYSLHAVAPTALLESPFYYRFKVRGLNCGGD